MILMIVITWLVIGAYHSQNISYPYPDESHYPNFTYLTNTIHFTILNSSSSAWAKKSRQLTLKKECASGSTAKSTKSKSPYRRESTPLSR